MLMSPVPTPNLIKFGILVPSDIFKLGRMLSQHRLALVITGK